LERTQILRQIAAIRHATDFEKVALAVFQHQAKNNALYAQFLKLLSISPTVIHQITDIPFLPISFFKTHDIKSGSWESELIFSSSGTTGQVSSKHHLRSKEWYQQLSLEIFQQFYGAIDDYCILALLPSYLERGGSSLVFMIDEFIRRSRHSHSGFFLKHEDQLTIQLQHNQKAQIPTLLIGVSFALLDFAESNPQDLSHCIIMETGGMKGRRKELTRDELHQTLCAAFNTRHIHSEYGMTELLSQSYSKESGRFYPGFSKKVLCRELTDPFQLLPAGRSGVLNVIDLGNVDTCSFIATEDLGRVFEDGSFEVMGRLDNSELRGCSLMLE
jgi:Acyl-protein synthetase, LuxE